VYDECFNEDLAFVARPMKLEKARLLSGMAAIHIFLQMIKENNFVCGLSKTLYLTS